MTTVEHLLPPDYRARTLRGYMPVDVSESALVLAADRKSVV